MSTQHRLVAIVAMASNRIIGAEGTLPWHLPGDLKFFKSTTMGHPVVMGRKTWDSIGRPLPGRRNIILSRTLGEAPEGTDLLGAPEALDRLEGLEGPIFIIGGAEIYRVFWKQTDEILLTEIPGVFEGDVSFPEVDEEFSAEEVVLETPEFKVRRYLRLPEASRAF